jgi:hypothetical protein
MDTRRDDAVSRLVLGVAVLVAAVPIALVIWALSS